MDKPYGIMTVEDYSGQHEFPLFGKDYIEYGKFLKKDLFVRISARIQERGADWKYQKKQEAGAPRQIECKLTSIDLLEDVKDRMISRLTVYLQLGKIDRMLTTELLSLFDENKGSVELCIGVHDPEERANMLLHSHNIRIGINMKLFDTLEELRSAKKLSYKVN